MQPIDYLKALGVALATLFVTLAASFPMVAVYAYFIEPGHDQAFYNAAAQWIAPWSSYIFGPILFFAFNFWLARRSPARNAIAFAISSIVLYVAVDLSLLPAMGFPVSAALAQAGWWLAVTSKTAAALAGAVLGRRAPRAPAATA